MSTLSDRIRAAGPDPATPVDTDPAPDGGGDPFAPVKDRAQDALVRRLGARLHDSSLGAAQLERLVGQELTTLLEEERTALDGDERAAVVEEITRDVLGYGPLEPFLADPEVTEIMANTADAVYVERDGRIQLTGARFRSDGHLWEVIQRIVDQVGLRIDESSPMVDARLPDGSRVSAVVPPLSIDGPMLTLRKFSQRRFTAADLVRAGTFSPAAAAFLKACVVGRCNVLVSGGAGSGTTTVLDVLASFIPDTERLVTIEDTAELQLHREHVVRLQSRPPDEEGRGEVTVRDLVRNSLLMRPDRIIVGETRSGEALDMLQAMNTGYRGSLSTLHANSPRGALSRLEAMVLMAGVELPVQAIREQVTAALDLIVHVARLRDGSRRVVRISEVAGQEGDTITLDDLYVFDFAAGSDGSGRLAGELLPVGIRPRFAGRLRDDGIELPPALFGVTGDGPTVGQIIEAWLSGEMPAAASEAQRRRRLVRRATPTDAE